VGRLKPALERKATWGPVGSIEGGELEIAWPAVEVVVVNCVIRAWAKLKRKISWLPSVLPRPTRLAVDSKAMALPSALMRGLVLRPVVGFVIAVAVPPPRLNWNRLICERPLSSGLT